MPLRKTLRGRQIKRTRRLGMHILIIFQSQPKGSPGERLLLPVRDYVAEVRVTFEPRQPDAPSAP